MTRIWSIGNYSKNFKLFFDFKNSRGWIINYHQNVLKLSKTKIDYHYNSFRDVIFWYILTVTLVIDFLFGKARVAEDLQNRDPGDSGSLGQAEEEGVDFY